MLAGTPRATEAGVHAGQGLYLQCDVLYHVAHPGAALQPFVESAFVTLAAAVLVQRGYQRGDTLVETGDLVRGPILQILDVEAHDHQLVAFDGPVVGATHGLEFEDAHVSDRHPACPRSS
jgi:hypothetical protein